MQVEWTKEVLATLKENVRYCRKKFGEQAAINFYKSIKENEPLLAANSHMGKEEPILLNRKQSYRSLVVHKHFKIIYRIEADIIYVVDLWDTRSNPLLLSQRIAD